jgi:hypothetical protein
MAEVTRRVIIEVETRQKRSRLEAPDSASAERGFKAEADAATRAAESADRATESVKRHAEVSRTSSQSIVSSFREAGEGAFRFGRGLALLSASGSDDLKKLVQSVALAQGAFDVFAGTSKVFTSLAGVLGGPLAAAITAVTAALGAGAIAWSKWQAEAEAAGKAAEERLNKTLAKMDELEQRRSRFAGLGISAALTPAEREQRIRSELSRLEGIREAAAPAISRFEDTGLGPSIGIGTSGVRADQARALAAARETSRAAEKQADLTQNLYDLQREQIATQRTGLLELMNLGQQGALAGGAGVFGGIALGSTTAGFTGFLGQFDQKTEQLTRTFQDAIDKLIRISEQALRKADEIESLAQPR